jgi:hypothetical protein
LMDLNQRSAPFSAVQESKMSTVMIMRGEWHFAKCLRVPGPSSSSSEKPRKQAAGSRWRESQRAPAESGEQRRQQAAGSWPLAAPSARSSQQQQQAAAAAAAAAAAEPAARRQQTAERQHAATATATAARLLRCARCLLPAFFACRRPRVRYTQGSGHARAQLEKSGGGSCLDLIANELPHA